jgi:hypothetical protein
MTEKLGNLYLAPNAPPDTIEPIIPATEHGREVIRYKSFIGKVRELSEPLSDCLSLDERTLVAPPNFFNYAALVRNFVYFAHGIHERKGKYDELKTRAIEVDVLLNRKTLREFPGRNKWRTCMLRRNDQQIQIGQVAKESKETIEAYIEGSSLLASPEWFKENRTKDGEYVGINPLPSKIVETAFQLSSDANRFVEEIARLLGTTQP